VDVVRNMPIPATDADYVQVGREHLDVLVDYAVHLAMLKCGGAEFQATMGGYENLVNLAIDNNLRLAAVAPNYQTFIEVCRKEQMDVPVRREKEEAVA
jgi:hypothetical protein